jgi:hypothetical protein
MDEKELRDHVQMALQAEAAATTVRRAAQQALRDFRIANQPYRIGDIVSVDGRIGGVTGFEHDGRPVVHRLRKDGTTSVVGKIYVWTNVELVKTAATPEPQS